PLPSVPYSLSLHVALPISALFVGLKCNRSFAQCARIYHDKTGEWPRGSWPGVFQPGSLESKRLVSDAMTVKQLMIQCKEALKKRSEERRVGKECGARSATA